ncbi:hypothetical protein CDAR_223471 [Caerostris darwini]|uniref:Uncharacterized protein n=1 Tax=Caerostris darwini TaxID=1538125 RepID=A0AAV4W6D8_9ARAC|nr:hypothetical protein CDAR_223471 [Caerostris darwini]
MRGGPTPTCAESRTIRDSSRWDHSVSPDGIYEVRSHTSAGTQSGREKVFSCGREMVQVNQRPLPSCWNNQSLRKQLSQGTFPWSDRKRFRSIHTPFHRNCPRLLIRTAPEFCQSVLLPHSAVCCWRIVHSIVRIKSRVANLDNY